MPENPIPIDFNIDNILEDGHKVIVPKFAKAMVRIAKFVATGKKRLLVAYPNYFCRYTSLLMLGCYFHFVAQKGSRAGIRILVVSKSDRTVSRYQKLTNSFGNAFVDFVYSGYLSKQGFRRLKPYGSLRGSASGKIDVKHSNIFIAKPSFLGQVSEQPFDLCILEDCQILMSKRYYKALEKLAGTTIPIFAILTVPDVRVANRFEQSFGFRVFGWDETLLVKDARTFDDVEAFGLEETTFPSVVGTELPLDDYHKTLNMAWNAYAKSRKGSRGQNNEILDRIFIELARVLHSLMNLAFPWELLCEIEEKAGKFTLVKRLALVRMLMSQISKKLNDSLELENVLSLCESALSLKPTKQKYYEQNLGNNTVYFVAAPNEITARALKTFFVTKRGLNIITPDTEGQIRKGRVILNGLTGKVTEDYKLMKLIKTEKLDVLAYTHEKEFLERFEHNRSGISSMLDRRASVLKEFHINGHS